MKRNFYSYDDLVFTMRITKLAENDYYFDYPFEDMKIYGSADSLTEALELAKSSLEFTLFDMYEDNSPFPIFNEANILELEKNKKDNEYITLVSTNLKSILEKFGEKPITRTLSIKQYQDYWLKSNSISLSKYVQEKIDNEIGV